jgi:HK97 family phage major capsid protein
MPEVSNELRDQILKGQKDLLDTVELYAKEIKSLDGRIESTVQAKIDKLNVRLDELELKAFRPMQHAANELAKDENPERKSAYDAFLHKGLGDISPEQRKLIVDHAKTLTEGDSTTGGAFVVPEYVNDIIKSIILLDPVRQFAKIRTTASNSVKMPKRIGTMAATWTGEIEQQTQASGLKYSLEDVPNHVMTAVVEISIEDLEDNMFDMASEINSEIAEQFALAEGVSFVSGSGKKQPEGFMTNPSVAVDVTGSGTTLGTSGDVFTSCAHNLLTPYAKNATWFLNRQTIGAVRLLKDGQNRPIWLPFSDAGLQGPNGPTILGIPYAEMPHMDNVGANKYPVALADWKRAYTIVDRVSISIKRDDVTGLDRGVVRFLARKRVGGQLVLAEAIRKIKVST